MLIINQPFGLGDIIFSMTAIRSFKEKILWPVFPAYVEGCNRAYPDIHFIDHKLLNIDFNIKHQYKIQDAEVLPMRFKDTPLVDCMKNKYWQYNLDWKTWKENASYKRYPEKENALYDLLQINNEPFNLISETFQADFNGSKKIIVDNGFKNIHLRNIAGYSLFDWSRIIEEAETIHAVSSSIIYLLELLKLQATEIKIYKREPRETTHDNYKYILQSHEYILE